MAELKPEQIIALLVPIVVIQLGLMIAALLDLEREDRRVRGGSKVVWALIIVLVNVVGTVAEVKATRTRAAIRRVRIAGGAPLGKELRRTEELQNFGENFRSSERTIAHDTSAGGLRGSLRRCGRSSRGRNTSR